jgi:hypothetical protein
LVITPAGNNKTTDGYNETNIDETNASSFDWVNIQSYYGYPSFSQDLIASLKNINYPSSSIAVGVDTDSDTPCQPQFPDFDGLKGIFNWNMTADSDCGAGYEYTLKIAKDVGY